MRTSHRSTQQPTSFSTPLIYLSSCISQLRFTYSLPERLNFCQISSSQSSFLHFGILTWTTERANDISHPRTTNYKILMNVPLKLDHCTSLSNFLLQNGYHFSNSLSQCNQMFKYILLYLSQNLIRQPRLAWKLLCLKPVPHK